MFGWRRGNRRGCYVVMPIGCLLAVLLVLLVSGLAIAPKTAEGFRAMLTRRDVPHWSNSEG